MNKKIKIGILATLIATSALTITLPIVSCSSSTSNVDNIQLIVNNDVKKNVEELVTDSLRNKMQEDGITRERQKEIAESWFIGKQIPEDELKIIKENLKFKDKSTDKDIPFDDAINIVVFKTDTIIPSSGNISGPELKFSFNDGYTWDDSFKVGSLGNAASMGLIVENSVMQTVVDDVTKSLTDKIQIPGINNAQQAEIVNKWLVDTEIEIEELNIIKEKLRFKDIDGNDVTFLNAVENITFETETFVPNFGVINGPKLKVNFKDGYNGDISIQTGNLGDAAMPIELTVEDIVMQTVIDDVTKSLFDKMQAPGITNPQQIAIANEWLVGNEIPKDELDLISPILNFKDGDRVVLFNDAVKSITINKGIELPSFGTILGPELKINFNAGYFGDDLIQVGELGDFVLPITLTVEDSVMQSVINDVTKSIFDKLQSGHVTYNMQKEIEEKWQINSDLPEDELQIIKENLKFKDGSNEVAFDDVVESLAITKNMIVDDDNNLPIISPEIKINLNVGYTGNFSIKVGNLGSSFALSDWRSDRDSVLITSNALTETLRNEMQKEGITYQQQVNLANSWHVNSRLSDYLIEIIKNNYKVFNSVSGNTTSIHSLFTDILFYSKTTIPEPGIDIYGPQIIIWLKPLGNHNRLVGFFLQIGNLGEAASN